MNDLDLLEKQLAIYCGFILDPDATIRTIDDMFYSNDESEQKRAEKIYNIIASYYKGDSNFIADIESIDADAKFMRLAMMVGGILADNSPSKKQHTKKKFLELGKNFSASDDSLIIKTDDHIPIDHSDLVFLNQLAAITENTLEEVNKLSQFNDQYYRKRLKDIYFKCQYYFEQAFCNVDILVQEKILNCIDTESDRSERHKNPDQAEAYDFLEQLYIVSSIDKKLLKSNVKFTKDKAFESFIRVLQNKDKSKTVEILLNDESIMKEIFNYKYNNKGSLSTLKHLFISTVYPYNDSLLESYTKFQKRTEEGLKRDLEELREDPKFSDAYDKYNYLKDIEILKTDSELLISTLEEEPDDLILGQIKGLVQRYSVYDNPVEDILMAEEVNEFMKGIYGYLVKHGLYRKDKQLTNLLNNYLNVQIDKEFYLRKNTIRIYNKENCEDGLSPSDMWYEINSLLDLFKSEHISKVYLKYVNDTYEFEPFDVLIKSEKSLLRSDFSALPENVMVVELTFERIKNLDVYLYKVYYRIIRQLLETAIQVEVTLEDIEKGFFKKSKVRPPKSNSEIDEEDAKKIKQIIIEYVVLALLISKNQNLFLGQYKNLAPDLLRELHGFKKQKQLIDSQVKVKGGIDLIKLFDADKIVIGQLHKDIMLYGQNNFMKGLLPTIKTFTSLIDFDERVIEAGAQ